MNMRGKFITVEGPDGAGKTTQIQGIAQFLAEQNIPFLCTREPGGDVIGQKIRELLLDPENETISPRAEAFLYAADRAQHVENMILPALEKGIWVICDRFVDSQMAYQGYGRGLDIPDLLQPLNVLATQGLVPDRTFLLLVTAEQGLARVMKNRGSMPDRMEQQKIDFHQRVCAGYQIMAKKHPERIVVLDGTAPVDEIQKNIREYLTALL